MLYHIVLNVIWHIFCRPRHQAHLRPCISIHLLFLLFRSTVHLYCYHLVLLLKLLKTLSRFSCKARLAFNNFQAAVGVIVFHLMHYFLACSEQCTSSLQHIETIFTSDCLVQTAREVSHLIVSYVNSSCPCHSREHLHPLSFWNCLPLSLAHIKAPRPIERQEEGGRVRPESNGEHRCQHHRGRQEISREDPPSFFISNNWIRPSREGEPL